MAGRYRLDARIGSGGMSTVYRAFDNTLQRQVAIKRMHREVAEDSDQLERFRREARAVAQLNHANIVGIIDAGEEDDTPFIVFEYVDGETLKQRIKRLGRLSITDSIAYAIEIARALGAAHARGIVHRDVKPQNVLINDAGMAKVTDFGIARSLNDPSLTADGRVLGTTDYVSPEQAMGHHVSGQSDIYSLGIVLYEMLIGEVPFKGDNPVAVAMQHVREEIPDVQQLRPKISSPLAAVVDRATAKPLDVRYENTNDLIADLEDVLTIEASRRGHVEGEGGEVFHTLPRNKRQQANLHITRRELTTRRYLPLVAGAVAATILALFLIFKNLPEATTKGTAQVAPTPVAQTETTVSLSATSANAYDPPPGDGKEHSDQIKNLIDDNQNTTWTSEAYSKGSFGQKRGMGFYLDTGSSASQSVSATQLSIRTSTEGWNAVVYAANGIEAPETLTSGWLRVGTITNATRQQAVQLDTESQRYRYYLVWFTKLPAPDSTGASKISISDVALVKKSS